MKKKLILIAAMALSALSYSAATNSVVNITVTAELVQAADVTAPAGNTSDLTVTYNASDLTTLIGANTTFTPVALDLNAYAGANAGLSVNKNIALTGTTGTVNAVASLASTTGDLTMTDDGTLIKLEGTLVGATSSAEFGLDIPDFGTQLPMSGTYTATIPVNAYYN